MSDNDDRQVLVSAKDVHEALERIDDEHGGYPDGPARTVPALLRLAEASGWKPPPWEPV